MTRAVSDGRCAFGDGDLLGSPDSGSRHHLGGVANRRNLMINRPGPMHRRQRRLGSSGAVKVNGMNLDITISKLVLFRKREND
jgi:hypothetical protein